MTTREGVDELLALDDVIDLVSGAIVFGSSCSSTHTGCHLDRDRIGG